MSQPSILVLATGGTIAGRAGSAVKRDYRPGQIAIGAFLEMVDALGLPVSLHGRQVANIDSADVGPAIWHELHAACTAAMADPSCDGVIVTHGTDTAEETAFLLDQTLPTSKPVVLVGAMRPADAVGSDGLRNFAIAMQVAADRRARGRGVLLVMGDQVFAARDARKARTSGTNAFAGFPRGPVALATPASIDWLEAPWRTGEVARHAMPDSFAAVPILHAFAGMGTGPVRLAAAEDSQGIVLAGLGEGNAPTPVRAALAQLAQAGTLIVRASRTDEGLVDRDPADDEFGFITARALGPAKSRILLQLLIDEGVRDPAEAQAAFDSR